MPASYLWSKALHVAFMVTWFAGLSYLLIVLDTALVAETWFRLKLLPLAALAAYHCRCYRRIVTLRGETAPRDSGWLRGFGHEPAAFLLAVAKPL